MSDLRRGDGTEPDVIAAAEAWIAADPDPETRAELERLIEAGHGDELAERMAGTLEFGTAGLRGRVEAGSNRMNRAVVIRTTAGLAAHYLSHGGDGPIVVGYDARLSSRRFMEDTVGVLAAAGIPVRHFTEPVPTPLVAFVALAMGARGAVVITASHNPPADNGYKVYDTNGAQIVPPVDTEIAAAIATVGPAVDVPLLEEAWPADLVEAVADDFFDRYLEALEAVRRASPERPGELAMVYTPMHGVGGRFVVDALRRSGYTSVEPVVEQFEPDGRFPTVAFPNPEEPGALDLAIARAKASDADLIIANDPDTDRLAVAVVGSDGEWTPLTGNQIGVLLADHILSHTAVEQPLVINSIVSSPMLAAVAEHHGAASATTLTGFKWIWNAALDLEAATANRFVFGYEEALGYSVTGAVRDKDGISAAVVFADLVACAAERGEAVRDVLAGLYRRDGMWVSAQRSVIRTGTEGAAEIAAAIEALADDPPTEVDGEKVVAVTDYRTGVEQRPRYLGATPLVELDLGEVGRVLVRPSGTEPKLKIYVDLRTTLAADDPVDEVETTLTTRALALGDTVAQLLGLT